MAAVQATAVADNIIDQTHVLNITVPGSLTNAVLIVCTNRSSRTVDTFSSDVDGALTLITHQTDFDNLSWYILKNPTSGAHVITVVFVEGSARGRLAGYVIDNVDQTTSTGSPALLQGTGSEQVASLTVTSSSGDLVVGSIIVGSGSVTISVTGGETSLGGDKTWVVASSDFVYEAGIASSTPLDWSWGSNVDFLATGFAVLDDGGGGDSGAAMRYRRAS